MTDTTDRKEMEELFHLQDAALQAAANAIVITSADGTIRWVNRAFSALTGYCVDEAIGKTPGELIRSGEQGREFYSNLWNTILAGDVWHGELVNRRKNGSLYCEEQSISPVRDARGTITHFIAIKQDITERRHMASRLAYQANYDGLTQLPNRYLCVDRLQHALTTATRHGRSVGVLSLDIDRFRTLNDALGHDAGDEALRAVAQRLRDTVRGEDTVARISADEFAVILADLAQPLDAALVAKKVADAFNVPFRVKPSDAGGEGLEFMFSVSVGVSLHPNDGADSEMLLNRAQTAMHRAKEHGPGQHQFFTADMDRAERQRLDLHNALRHALEQGEFALHFQPQTDATGERIVGAEALLRWNRPGHGQVSPAEFLPMLEETGLIVPVGEWVLHQACAQFMALRDAGVPIPHIAINVSARQLQHDDFIDAVVQASTDAGMGPGTLELEVTESTLMLDAKGHFEMLRRLHDNGIRIALDDFGTGYSSLSYLKELRLDVLKIDRSFVRELPENKSDVAIVQAIVALGRALQLDIVAEGVETQQQRRCLRSCGCNILQGYLLSHPLSAEELFSFLCKKAEQERRWARESNAVVWSPVPR